MNRRDESVWNTALALVAQYGDDAEIIATLRAAEFAAVGDLEGLAAWDRIIETLVDLDQGRPPPGLLN